VLTNGASEFQRRKLEVSALEPELDAIAISEEIGAAKPDRAAFTAALALLGTRPNETAMVGDSLANDVQGALSADLAAVVWMNPNREPPRGAVGARSLAIVPSILGLA
jgi:putative hydrolase of the HAD superfamily